MKRKLPNANRTRHTRPGTPRASAATGAPAKPVWPTRANVPGKLGADTVWHSVVMACVTTAAIFGIVWKWIDPALASNVGVISSLQDATLGFPSFYLTGDFLREKLSQPGGLACYVSSFLCQTYSVSWLGSLLLSLEALAIWLGVYALLRRAASLRAAVEASKCAATPVSARLPEFILPACAVPSLLLLGTWTNGLPYPSATLSVILGIYGAWLGSWLRPRDPWARLVILVVLGMLVFMTGTSALLIFVALGLFLEIMAGLGWGWAAKFLCGGCLVPLAAGRLLYGLSAWESVSLMIPAGLSDWDLRTARQTMHTFGLSDRVVPTATLMGAVYLSAAACGPICLAITHYTQRVRRTARPGTWLAGTAILLGCVFAIVCATWNDSLHTFFAVEYYAAQQKWDRARSAAKGHEWNPYISCVATQAAYHTGDLVKELPVLQNPEDLLLVKREARSSCARAIFTSTLVMSICRCITRRKPWKRLGNARRCSSGWPC